MRFPFSETALSQVTQPDLFGFVGALWSPTLFSVTGVFSEEEN